MALNDDDDDDDDDDDNNNNNNIKGAGIAQWYSAGPLADDRGMSPGRGWESSSPPPPDRPRGPSSLPSNGHQGLPPRRQSGRDQKPTTHPHPAWRPRMHGATPTLANTPSWRGDRLRKKVQEQI